MNFPTMYVTLTPPPSESYSSPSLLFQIESEDLHLMNEEIVGLYNPLGVFLLPWCREALFIDYVFG